MNVGTGEDGVHVVRTGNLIGIFDYGPANTPTAPKLMAALNRDDIFRLRAQLMMLAFDPQVGEPDQSDLIEGHLWTLAVTSTAVYRVGEDPTLHQAEHLGWVGSVSQRVRAWDLPTALRRAADRPLSEWSGWSHDDVV